MVEETKTREESRLKWREIFAVCGLFKRSRQQSDQVFAHKTLCNPNFVAIVFPDLSGRHTTGH